MASNTLQRVLPDAPRARLAFYASSALALLTYAAGAYVVMILALAGGSYLVGRMCGRAWYAPAATWLYTIVVLLASEWYHDRIVFGELLGAQFAVLDTWRGLYGWHRGLNLVALRLISFNMDRYWALLKGPAAAAAAGSNTVAAPVDYEQRVVTPLPPSSYDVLAFLAYVFYVPLHLAGPILPANAFLWQIYRPPQPPSTRTLLGLLARLVFAVVLMEAALHADYVYAVALSGAYRGKFPPADIGMLVYFSLHLIWLKFLIIWRFFRLWAMADNVETVENMNRCMSNNYTLQVCWAGVVPCILLFRTRTPRRIAPRRR